MGWTPTFLIGRVPDSLKFDLSGTSGHSAVCMLKKIMVGGTITIGIGIGIGIGDTFEADIGIEYRRYFYKVSLTSMAYCQSTIDGPWLRT